jgi:Transposase DDE domain group 1
MGYTIGLPANRVLQDKIGHLLKRPVGRPPQEVQRYYASFHYQAGSWSKSRRVVAKVEWHLGEIYPRVGFIVTNLAQTAERVIAFYNHRGTCEQYVKEGKGAIKWTRLSCRSFAANAVRLQLHALAYNLRNFMRTLAMPKTAEPWSLTSLREKLIKIGAKVASHGRYVTFQMAEVAVSRQMFAEILSLIARLGVSPAPTFLRCQLTAFMQNAQSRSISSHPSSRSLINPTVARNASRKIRESVISNRYTANHWLFALELRLEAAALEQGEIDR